MKVGVCLLLAAYLPYVVYTAASGGGDRKKRSTKYANTYYGAAPSVQYENLGYGMAGQKPYYSKMKYTDPLSGERYKAWLAGQAMYGRNFKPVKPVLGRKHWYLNYLLKHGMYNQYQALRTPGNKLWKMYGFSLYGNAGNGKYRTKAQKYRRKRSSYGYGSEDYGYGTGGYGSYGKYDKGYGS
eukprot:TRINITY_DN107_c0_g1_i4.p2 TRINITY_DN107_c0_g1~~TRINITY_DN107_c0_g1_i4.p2  ORF type:complete len:183 (-),score=33.14 TRINITY_DN107_c0_g1_i4:288-836(-)